MLNKSADERPTSSELLAKPRMKDAMKEYVRSYPH